MNVSRRALLALGLGATQLALLERFGSNRAFAGPTTPKPATKLLSIWIPGGLNHEQQWGHLSDAGIAKFIPSPMGGNKPYFYNAAMVKNLDGSSGGGSAGYRPVRAPIWWNPQNPQDKAGTNPASGQLYVPYGYSWVSKDLGNPQAVFERAVLMHGIDQGTAAHESGQVASMCGVAGAEFRAPAVAAVVANAMAAKFPDRPLPSVSLHGSLTPKAVTIGTLPMSGAANPIFLDDAAGLEHSVSDHPDSAWKGLRARQDIDDLAFDGTPTGKRLSATTVEQQALAAVRGQRGRSSAGTDALMQTLYDSYSGMSRTLARDVVDVLGKTPGVEHLPAVMPWAPADGGRFAYILGYADGGSDNDWDADFDMTLRLLKSDLCSAVTLKVAGAHNLAFDTHGPPAGPTQGNDARAVYEIIGRLIIEMMMTPSPSQPGQSLLDETVVHIFSDFGRTFVPPTSTNSGTDHHPATSVILIGGGVQGNRMIGGYDETTPAGTTPLGAPVNVLDLESGGGAVQRVPRASDAAATVLRCFGLEAGKDFFIPGGYGEIAGVLT